MTVDTILHGLACCRDWESLKGELPECRTCPFKAPGEASCETMTEQIQAAMELIRRQKGELDELHAGILALKRAVDEA